MEDVWESRFVDLPLMGLIGYLKGFISQNCVYQNRTLLSSRLALPCCVVDDDAGLVIVAIDIEADALTVVLY